MAIIYNRINETFNSVLKDILVLKRDVLKLACPKCSSNQWSFEVDFLGTRIHNGVIVCERRHKWVITREILRFDNENDHSEPIYIDTPLTGFPASVEEQERLSFLNHLREEIEGFVPSEITQVYLGNLVLLFEYLKDSSGELIVVHNDEKVLKQIQDIAVSKLLYPSISLIKADFVDISAPFEAISLMTEMETDQQKLYSNAKKFTSYKLTEGTEGTIIWKGSKTALTKHIG